MLLTMVATRESSTVQQWCQSSSRRGTLRLRLL